MYFENTDVFSENFRAILTNTSNSPDDNSTFEFIPYAPNVYSQPPLILDADGNEYTAVNFGYGTWLAQNLRTTKYNDGTPMDYRWYHGQAVVHPYGGLYTWNSLYNSSGKNPCPAGWRLPTDTDWNLLLQQFNSTSGYNSLLLGGNTGFDAVLGGRINFTSMGPRSGYSTLGIGDYGYYWSSGSVNSSIKKGFQFDRVNSAFSLSNSASNNYRSCRCIKD